LLVPGFLDFYQGAISMPIFCSYKKKVKNVISIYFCLEIDHFSTYDFLISFIEAFEGTPNME
jgi:hypothetical protein